MRNPIPQDWDGESWKRYCVCWPDSELWTGLLLGFLSYCTRGRSWHENTGSIKDAQAIGWQIWENNYPLEEVFMSCTEGQWVAKAILYHAAVTGGFAIEDFPEELTQEFFETVDFTSLGLANRLGPNVPQDSPDTVQATIARLEEMIGTVQNSNDNVAKALIFLTTGLLSLTTDFSQITDLNLLFSGQVDFTSLGLANRIAPSGQQTATSSLSNRMDQIREAIEALSINVNVENGTIELPGGAELANIVTELEELGTILETRSVAETVAQNTNFEDLVAAVAALQLQCETIVNTTNLSQTISCGEGGSGGAGSYPADPSGQTTTPEDEAGDPPPGFDSWAQFRQYQCDMAYLIMNQMIADIATGAISAAIYGTIATLGPILIAALLTPIGWSAIIGIATLWIAIWAIGVEVSLLSQLLEDNKEEFVCELLDGTSVSSSISSFADLVSSRVDGEATLGALPDSVRSQIKQLIVSYATIDSINRLYEKTPLPPPGGNDCSDCEETTACELFIPFMNETEIAGTVIGGSLSSGSVEVASEPISWGGNPEAPTEIVVLQGSECCLRITSISSTHGNMIHWTEADVAGCGDDIPYFASGLPPVDTCCNRVYLRREDGLVNIPFTITMTWQDCG